MSYTINDKNLIADIKENYSNYIGKKQNNKDCETPYTGILHKIYIDTFEIAKLEVVRLNKDESKFNEKIFKTAFDKMEHPLDSEVINFLVKVIGDKDELLYSNAKELDKLWGMLLSKSIKCLRYFDIREPFMFDSSKNAVAYGIDKLEEYHNRYTQFESLLYGASEYYRDHIFHAIRTWLIGIFCLLHNSEAPFIDSIQIDGVAEDEPFAQKINFLEKLSIWTISALCHDLGYPLEKSQQVLDKTKNMMREFVPNPTILSNFAFTGIQDNINEYIVKFMSTKMKVADEKNGEKIYHGRIQPKYYLKYTKSLETNKHGIISAIIIYKMLLYFMEADFNLNDDYTYNLEDARQFYIRREILRSIASHTCSDIYNVKNTTFSSLLFICDEMQEWGRKSWNDLYTNVDPDSVELSIDKFNATNIQFSEKINMENIKDMDLIIDNIIRLYNRQFEQYQIIFRDGQYTNSRAFDIRKKIYITAGKTGSLNNNIIITYSLLAKSKNSFSINLTDSQLSKERVENALKKELNLNKLPQVIKITGKKK